MCGINGSITRGANRLGDAQSMLAKNAENQSWRGPDGHGTWVSPDGRVGFAHRRLAIIDLSPAGHQPMGSHSGRFVIAFNGEVFNFIELREELEQCGNKFRGHSDTEVMLQCFEEWGIEASIKRFIGMFAFAVWDRDTNRVTFARDRMGQKPLMLRITPDRIDFASTLPAIGPGEDELDRAAVIQFLRHSYIPNSATPWVNTFKLPIGCILEIDLDGPFEFKPRPYWSLSQVVEAGRRTRLRPDLDAAADLLDATLSKAVERQLISDVPLGGFLSGGVDSSLIVAMMAKAAPDHVKTFTIGFREPEFDEAPFARAVAEHLGTEHHEHYVDAEEALSVVDKLPDIFDEPFADSSQIPTFLVSKLAKEHVTVALSGDGGDELFGGYRRYFDARNRRRRLERVPRPLREAGSRAIMAMPRPALRAVLRGARPILPARFRVDDPAHHARRIAASWRAESPQEIYQGFLNHAPDAESLVRVAPKVPHLAARTSIPSGLSFEEEMMFIDTVNYMPDDIHVKVDRASMAVSLEARAPFMDHSVVELAWRLPLDVKMNQTHGKLVVRKVLSRYVRPELFDRPKKGFGIPIASWLRGPLRSWADDLLDDHRLSRQGIFRPEPIARRWRAHKAGTADWGFHLWDVLMFQAWYDRYGAPSLRNSRT